MTRHSLPNRQPDATLHDPRPEYLRALLAQAGLSQREAARRLGLSPRALRYYCAGERTMPDGTRQPYLAPYVVQYALEGLAADCDRPRASQRKVVTTTA